MTNILDFVKDKNFSTGSSFPEGDTFLSTNTEIKESTQEWEGKTKTRYEFIDNQRSYFAGSKVMEGIQKAIQKAKKDLVTLKSFRVTKTGEGKNTTYTVVGITE